MIADAAGIFAKAAKRRMMVLLHHHGQGASVILPSPLFGSVGTVIRHAARSVAAVATAPLLAQSRQNAISALDTMHGRAAARGNVLLGLPSAHPRNTPIANRPVTVRHLRTESPDDAEWLEVR